MPPRVTFTKAAKRSCRRYGIDQDEAVYVLENPTATVDEPDPEAIHVASSGLHRQPRHRYSLGELEEHGRWIEVMSEELADSVRIWRVIEIPDPSSWD